MFSTKFVKFYRGPRVGGIRAEQRGGPTMSTHKKAKEERDKRRVRDQALREYEYPLNLISFFQRSRRQTRTESSRYPAS